MHELLQKIRIGISLGFRFPLAAWRYVRCAHMELQFVRNLGASCRPCVFPVTSRFATGTPALPRYAPRSVTIRGGSQNRYACWTVALMVFFLVRAHMDSLVMFYPCYSSLGA